MATPTRGKGLVSLALTMLNSITVALTLSGDWKEGVVADLPFARIGHVGGVHAPSGTVFIVGGYDGTYNLNALDALDTQKNEWSVLPDMPTNRSDLSAGVLGDMLYVAGGEAREDGCPWADGGLGICNLTKVEGFNITTGSWATLPSMNVARRGLQMGVDAKRGKIYTLGGMNCKDNCYGDDVEYIGAAEVLDVATGVWSVLPSMPTGRRDLGVGVDESTGKVYAIGGCGNSTTSQECYTTGVVEVFDPATNSWSEGMPMLTPRHGITVCVLPSSPHEGVTVSFLVLGGAQDSLVYAGPTPLATAENFVPSSNSWNTVASMPSARYAAAKGYGLVLNVDGDTTRAYVVGGAVAAGDVMTSAVEVFDM